MLTHTHTHTHTVILSLICTKHPFTPPPPLPPLQPFPPDTLALRVVSLNVKGLTEMTRIYNVIASVSACRLS